MGLLDFLGGLGQANAAPWAQRLTSGMGQQGGMLQQMGLGRFGGQTTPGMGQQMGQGNNFATFLHGLGSQLQGGQQGQQGQQDQSSPLQQQQAGQPQTPGLAALIQQYLQQNMRQ